MKSKRFNHPLMFDNFNKKDFLEVKKFISNNNILTQNEQVLKFEKKWSDWLGVKYSVFVNSGSSANYLTFACLKHLYNLTGEVIVPPLTWISDIVSVIDNGFKPVFADIDLKTLSLDEKEVKKKITKKTKVVFITHAQGFDGFSDDFIKMLKKNKILLIEDVCESHGATHNNKKLGTFGKISNFSFYYAHHMSTIEGGMVSTNDRKIYETCRMLRGHGMLREVTDKKFEKLVIKKNSQLSPKFIFLYPGFNFRNNEIGATIGLNQLKRLNYNIKQRRKNFSFFLKKLNKKLFFTEYKIEGNSNYAFPIILKTNNFSLRNKFEKCLTINNIEFRRGNAGGGNQLRQPYLKKIIKNKYYLKFKNTEKVHHFGYYIGNYPSLRKDKILRLCSILNNYSK